jgi:hypothetical protein
VAHAESTAGIVLVRGGFAPAPRFAEILGLNRRERQSNLGFTVASIRRFPIPLRREFRVGRKIFPGLVQFADREVRLIERSRPMLPSRSLRGILPAGAPSLTR